MRSRWPAPRCRGRSPTRRCAAGFRYLTLFLSSPGYVDIGAVSLNYTAAPLQKDPAAYNGWFLSSDNQLNKIWYAGAYTVQVDTGMSDTAKSWPYATREADQYKSQIPYADPDQEVIFDGGKRDREAWQGDSAAAAAYSAQAVTVKNAINSLLWDDTVGAYRLSLQTPDVYPQDGNATAILAGVASQQQADRALAYLRASDWSTYGSLEVSPSTPNSVISPVYEPLPSGFEATARLSGTDPDELGFDTGLQLIRQFWGWMPGQDPGSTF